MTRRWTQEEPCRVDALSDVLKTIRMTGAVFFNSSASSPWASEQLSRLDIMFASPDWWKAPRKHLQKSASDFRGSRNVSPL